MRNFSSGQGQIYGACGPYKYVLSFMSAKESIAAHKAKKIVLWHVSARSLDLNRVEKAIDNKYIIIKRLGLLGGGVACF